jgi:hypothetical protein
MYSTICSLNVQAQSAIQKRRKEDRMTQAEIAALASADPAAGARERTMPMIQDHFDPVALSGTANAAFAQRLAYQVATCQWLAPASGDQRHAEEATSAVAALKELAPANAVEALLATQMVAAHNASLDILQRAMAHGQADRATEERTRQYARLSEVFLRQLDRFQRQRGRQRQTIRIEHVRVVEDGKVTVRQEEERVR